MADRTKEEIPNRKADTETDTSQNLHSDLRFSNSERNSYSDEKRSFEDDKDIVEMLIFPSENKNAKRDGEIPLSSNTGSDISETSIIYSRKSEKYNLHTEASHAYKTSTESVERKQKHSSDDCNKDYLHTDTFFKWTEIESTWLFLLINKVFLRGYSVLLLCQTQILSHFLKSIIGESSDIIVVGSFAEGNYFPKYSDIDSMIVYHNCLCCETYCQEKLFSQSNKQVYVSDRRNASPGYTLLWDFQSIKTNQETAHFKPFLEYENEDSLVTVSFPDNSVKMFPLKELVVNHNALKTAAESVLPKQVSFTGPALHASFLWSVENLEYLLNMLASFGFVGDKEKFIQMLADLKQVDFDYVFAIPFKCKTIMRQWLGRKRRHNWPCEKLLQEIAQMPGYVVPIGKKGSKFEHYEFRICYTPAEIKLIRSLNEVQMSLFIVLRIYAKDYKADFPNITSYIIKNLILWIAESVPISYFKRKNLIPLIKSTLHVLKRCAEKGYLPNYMIPSRNLFDGKVEEKEMEQLIETLSHFTGEGSAEITTPFHKQMSEVLTEIMAGDYEAKCKETEREIRKQCQLSEQLIPLLLTNCKGLFRMYLYVFSITGWRPFDHILSFWLKKLQP